MRAIEFRGIRKDNGEIVFGHYFNWFKYGKIIPIIGEGVKNGSVIGFEVIPETICQYTGLKGKNGIKIFSGDWIKSSHGYTSYIEFKNGAFWSIYTHPEDGEELLIIDLDLKNIEVIGNIHEHNYIQ